MYAGYFSFLTLQRYAAFEARALDLGNLNQALWNMAHGNWFRMTNQEEGVVTRLAMHVEPILLLLAPFYRLWPTPEALLVFQAVVVALGALPLFALARHQQLGDWLGLVFAVAFLLNPTVQAANWLEFHPVTLAPTFLMAAFYFLVTGRTGWFALFAALAAGCKEEIGLLVFMLGLYAWLALKRPRLGLVTMVLGLGWSLIAVLGIQAYFAGGNIHWGRYGYLGAGTTDKLLTLLTRPDLIWAQLQQAQVLRLFVRVAAAGRLHGPAGARSVAPGAALPGNQPPGRLCAHAAGDDTHVCRAGRALCDAGECDGGGAGGGIGRAGGKTSHKAAKNTKVRKEKKGHAARNGAVRICPSGRPPA